MADNTPVPDGAPKTPTPLPNEPEGTAPVFSSPQPKKPGAGKMVVMLSSVAKPPPSQLIVGIDKPGEKTPDDKPSSRPKARWPSLSGTPVLAQTAETSVAKEAPQPVAKVKPPPLPFKSLEIPNTPDIPKAPPLPKIDGKKISGKLIPPIKLDQPSGNAGSSVESLFADADKSEPLVTHPAGWKPLEPGELIAPPDGLQSLDAFSRSQKTEDRPAAEVDAPKAEAKAVVPEPVAKSPVEEMTPVPALPPLPPLKPLVMLPPIAPHPDIHVATLPPPVVLSAPAHPAAQPLVMLPPVAPYQDSPGAPLPPVVLSAPAPVEAIKKPSGPPPLPFVKKEEKTEASAIQVAPPLVESETTQPAHHAEKLPQPALPSDGPKDEMTTIVVSKSTDSPETTALHKAPALIPSEPQAKNMPLPALTTQDISPVPTTTKAPAPKKVTGPIVLRDTPGLIAGASAVGPLVIEAKSGLSSTAKTNQPIKVEPEKPALRPAVLPNRTLAIPKTVEPEAMKPPGNVVVPVAAPAAAPLPPPVPVKAVPSPASGAPPAVQPAPVKAVPAKQTEIAVALPKTQTPAVAKTPEKTAPVVPEKKKALPPTRAERAKKRRIVEMIVFYIVMLIVGALLYWGGIHFGRETRVEGQVIPPAGMPLDNEAWIVIDFRKLTSGVAEDLANERAPLLQEIQERQDHVQRAQADIATREERLHLLENQIQAFKDEQASVVKQARDATQQLWDGPGADLDSEYDAKVNELQSTIAERAKSLKLNYQPDDSYHSPEVWANAYRLALYQVPAGVDSVKEHQWLSDQMKAWRAFLKSMDDRKEQLRDQAAQIKLAPAAKITDLNSKIDELGHRIEITRTEEDPIKAELAQAQADLAQAQSAEESLDEKYYKQLYALPGESVLKHIPLHANGRFSWHDIQVDYPFAEGEDEHHYLIFTRAVRADGREYWALGSFDIAKDTTKCLIIEPDQFVSTKAYLRPDLSPDEINQ